MPTATGKYSVPGALRQHAPHRAQFDRRCWTRRSPRNRGDAAQLGTLLEQKARTKALHLVHGGCRAVAVTVGQRQAFNVISGGRAAISVRTLRRRLSEDGSSFRCAQPNAFVWRPRRRLLGEQDMTVCSGR